MDQSPSPVLIALLVSHIQGTLVSIELAADTLLFNYAFMLSNRIKCRQFKIKDITKLEYSGSFLNRLTVISNTDKLYINIDDSKKTPIKALIESVKRHKMSANQHNSTCRSTPTATRRVTRVPF